MTADQIKGLPGAHRWMFDSAPDTSS